LIADRKPAVNLCSFARREVEAAAQFSCWRICDGATRLQAVPQIPIGNSPIRHPVSAPI
jgi:hypothetical protein